MGTDLIPEARYLRVELPEWGIVAHWVFSEDGGKYLAISAQCGELGVSSNRQLQKIADDPDAYPPEAVREFRIETPGGRQVTRCLRKAEAALWIATISPLKVKAELRGHMTDIRARILQAADRIVFGDMTDVRAVATIQPRGGDVHLGGCPKCHTPLRVQYGPEGITLYIAEG